MRCLGRLIVLCLVIVLAAVLWLTRDKWLHFLPGSHGSATVT